MCLKSNLGYALGVLFAGISLACAVVVYAAPDLAHTILELLTHSTWQFAIQPFDAVRIIIGAALWFVIGWVTGFAFSKLCECEEKLLDKGTRKK